MYHLTPNNVVGSSFPRDSFGGAVVALMGFCPPALSLSAASRDPTDGQKFIHLSPSSVSVLDVAGHPVVSLSHVYGGPVASAAVEELSYYGVKYIIAYGLAGGLCAPANRLGEFYCVDDALAADGTTRHYTDKKIVASTSYLSKLVERRWKKQKMPSLNRVRAATGDAIYREDDRMLDDFRKEGCHIVNLDSAHLYAVARSAAPPIEVVQYGVVSDLATDGSAANETSLNSFLKATGMESFNPMRQVEQLVKFFLDSVVPVLVGAHNENNQEGT